MPRSGFFNNVPQTPESLRRKYRQLVLQMHPNKGGNVNAFKDMKNEYTRLQNQLANRTPTPRSQNKKTPKLLGAPPSTNSKTPTPKTPNTPRAPSISSNTSSPRNQYPRVSPPPPTPRRQRTPRPSPDRRRRSPTVVLGTPVTQRRRNTPSQRTQATIAGVAVMPLLTVAAFIASGGSMFIPV